MKTIFTFLFLTVFTLWVNAQFPIDFETSKDTTWEVFGNVTLDPANFKVAGNMDKSGINPSTYVLKFIVNDGGETWAGAWSENYAPMEFTEDEHTLTMMVNKSIISNCALKVEGTGLTAVEVKVPNTLTEQWEMLSFDFTAGIGNSYTRLVIFPDFPDVRDYGTTVYLDNIAWVFPASAKQLSGSSLKVFPNPVDDVMLVQYPDMKCLTISNLLGKTIKTYKFQNTSSKSVELGDLQTGMYFISVATGSASFTSKFMKR